jgi:hypothetical protein
MRSVRHACLLALVVACGGGGSSSSDGANVGSGPPEQATPPPGNAEAGSNEITPQSSVPDASATVDAGDPLEEVEPGGPHVQYIGRFDKSDPAHPRCAFEGCRIIARFSGTEVSATMRELFYDWMEGAPGEWDVIVDGQLTPKIVMTATDTKYVLATGLPPGNHTIELYRRSEPQTGITTFSGFDFGGGTLLQPPPRRTRHIEIIGDSSSAGFGIEGVGHTDANGRCPYPDHAAKWENFHKAYGALLGDIFNAEVFGSALSGLGIYKNGWVLDNDTLPVMFLRTIPPDDTSVWNFNEWKPNVVIVMAGGNDFTIGKPYDTGPATLEQFTGAYRDFAAKLRSVYPLAHLVLTVSPTTDDDNPPDHHTRTYIETGANTVVTERNAKGDAKVWFFEPIKAVDSEMTACYGHGSPEYHQRVASEIAAFIRPKLGW